jgi:hypothetical protein
MTTPKKPAFVIAWPTAAVVIAGIAAIVTAAALGVSSELVTIIGALATLAGGLSHALVERDPESH